MVISLGWLSPATSRGLPAAQATRAGSRCLLGLAPTGGYRATPVARRAVGSYPTVSPLPLESRAVCSLWPFPSPRGAQELPGSLPCGARTFLGTPLQPTCRDHHALPPPDTKATGSGRVGARLARQPPQQAAQAVERHALPKPGCLVWGEPKAVVLLEYQALQAGPVAGGQRGRRHGHGVREVQATAAVQRQQLARAQLRREQEQRPVGEGEPAQQSQRKPVGRRLGQAEREIEVAPLLQDPVAQGCGPPGDLAFQGAVIARQQPGVPQRRVTGPGRQRVELRPIAEGGDPAAPRGVAELLAHRVAAWALDVQAQGDDQSTLLRGQAAEGGVRAGESLGPQCRIERARCGESLAACPARRIGGDPARGTATQ